MKTENICLHKNLSMNVNRNITDNSKKVETTQIFIYWWIETQHVVFSYSGILHSIFVLKKVQSIVTCHNMDIPCKHYAKWKKSVHLTGYLCHVFPLTIFPLYILHFTTQILVLYNMCPLTQNSFALPWPTKLYYNIFYRMLLNYYSHLWTCPVASVLWG